MNDKQRSEDWAVTFTLDATSDEASLHKLAGFLDKLDGSVASLPPNRVTVTAHVTAASPIEAEAELLAVLTAATRQTGILARVRLLAAEAVAEDEYERRANAPTLPELVGASEVGGMLGVSRQRVHQLRENPAFPAPLVEVAMGPLWHARAIEAFAREWARRPGRPRLQVAQ